MVKADGHHEDFRTLGDHQNSASGTRLRFAPPRGVAIRTEPALRLDLHPASWHPRSCRLTAPGRSRTIDARSHWICTQSSECTDQSVRSPRATSPKGQHGGTCSGPDSRSSLWNEPRIQWQERLRRWFDRPDPDSTVARWLRLTTGSACRPGTTWSTSRGTREAIYHVRIQPGSRATTAQCLRGIHAIGATHGGSFPIANCRLPAIRSTGCARAPNRGATLLLDDQTAPI